jgi:hypothetical protein
MDQGFRAVLEQRTCQLIGNERQASKSLLFQLTPKPHRVLQEAFKIVAPPGASNDGVRMVKRPAKPDGRPPWRALGGLGRCRRPTKRTNTLAVESPSRTSIFVLAVEGQSSRPGQQPARGANEGSSCQR